MQIMGSTQESQERARLELELARACELPPYRSARSCGDTSCVFYMDDHATCALLEFDVVGKISRPALGWLTSHRARGPANIDEVLAARCASF